MLVGSITGEAWVRNGEILKLELGTNAEKIEIAKIIKENLEDIGVKIIIKEINNLYYKNNLQNLKYDILLARNMVSIKPSVQEYLNFNIEKLSTEEETYNKIYETYNKRPNFMGLYFNPIIILYSKKLKGDFNANWYNVFYNIDKWYKV